MFDNLAKKGFIFILIVFEMIIAFMSLRICDVSNAIKCFGVIALITIIFDCVLMKFSDIRLYSPASVFIILSYLFSFGQFILEAFFPNYSYRFDNVIRYRPMDVYNCATFCFVIIQLIFMGIILQRNPSNCASTGLNEYVYVDYKQIKKMGFVITIICFPVWLYYNAYTYAMTQTIGAYVVAATQVNGIVVEFAYFVLIGMVFLLIGYSNEKRIQKNILILEISLLLVSMLTGNRLFAVGAICVLFYCYNMLTNKQMLKQAIILLAIIYFIAAFVTSISHLRMDSALTISSIVEDGLSNSNQTFLFVLEEFGGSFKSPLKVLQQVPYSIPYSYGMTYINSLITLIPNFNEKIRTIYEHSIYVKSLRGNATMGGSYIGELFYNFGYFSYVIAVPMGIMIGKLTDKADKLILNKKFVEFSYYIMIIFGLFMWVRGYFTTMIRGPAWAALFIYTVNRFVVSLR